MNLSRLEHINKRWEFCFEVFHDNNLCIDTLRLYDTCNVFYLLIEKYKFNLLAISIKEVNKVLKVLPI